MESSEEQLQRMLENANDQLADFLEMGKKIGAKLDFSTRSIYDVEKILLQTNATEENDEDLFADCWLYIGICVQRSKNGTWIISEEDDESSGYPAVRYENIYGDLFCPIQAIRSFLSSRNIGDIAHSIHNS